MPGVRGGRRVAAWDRRLIPGDSFNFQEHLGRLVFQRIPHLLVVLLRVLPRPIFKFQVAQIVVDRVAALEELIELRAVRRGISRVGLNPENKNDDSQGENETGRSITVSGISPP